MRQRPWVALSTGFGGLLLLMAAAQIVALMFLNSLRANDARLQQRFSSRNAALEKIRSSIYLSGTFMRDSLLAPEPSGAQAQMTALEGLRKDTNAAVQRYGQELDVEEAAPFRSLVSEINAYWKVLGKTFAWTSEERSKYRYEFFYNELIPRRTSMLEIADRVGQINERALQRGNQQLNALFGRLQMGLLAMIALTLIGGAAIAGQASFVILRLQGEVRKRLEEATEARASLRDFPQNWSAPRKTSGARFPENCTTKPPSLSRPY